jgi:hypothetical protein
MTLAYGIGYAYAGWAVCAAGGAAYAVSLVVRGKRATPRVPEGRRRWSDPS